MSKILPKYLQKGRKFIFGIKVQAVACKLNSFTSIFEGFCWSFKKMFMVAYLWMATSMFWPVHTIIFGFLLSIKHLITDSPIPKLHFSLLKISMRAAAALKRPHCISEDFGQEPNHPIFSFKMTLVRSYCL